MSRFAAVAVLCGLAGCAPKPTAEAVCHQLEAAGQAKGCHQDKPEVFAARAKTKWVFDLPRVAGKTGQVLDFANADDYQATVDAFTKAAMLAGPHRYGSSKALVFVQMNTGASLDDGNKVKGIVDAL